MKSLVKPQSMSILVSMLFLSVGCGAGPTEVPQPSPIPRVNAEGRFVVFFDFLDRFTVDTVQYSNCCHLSPLDTGLHHLWNQRLSLDASFPSLIESRN